MNNNYYDLYVESVYQLAETLIIKSTQASNSMNELIAIQNPSMFDETDPTTWRYYLNISGEYHFADKPMYVTSLDTQTEILFSKSNLDIHRATKRGYAYGTRNYKELVSKYPEQEMLILGILYPVDIHRAIAARDGEILGYPEHLVEPNEMTLIENIQNWLDGFDVRWINPQYRSDDLYDVTSIAVKYLLLVPLIISLRLEACKTAEAHSFHVKQYLASHGYLDVYIDSMIRQQQMFFYRNINYIERNTGKADNFEWLTEHTMTIRGLPLAEFTMRHDIEDQPDEEVPTPVFRRKPLNTAIAGDTADVISLEEILMKEDKLAKMNPETREDQEGVIRNVLENSMSNVMMTKALESSMYDYSNSSPYSLDDILLHHWIWFSSTDLYKAYVQVYNPKTGESIPLNAKDAFVFAFYIFCLASGITDYPKGSINKGLKEVPPMLATRVQRIPTPSVDTLLSVVDQKYMTREQAEYVRGLQPDIVEMISTEAFYNTCYDIYLAANAQRDFVAFQEHYLGRGMAHGMISQLYSDNVVRMAPAGQTYDAWFAERNINISDFEDEDLDLIYLQIVRQATGADLITTKSLSSLQTAMVNMLTQLSSYSIQFMKEINATTLKKMDWPAVRLGDIDSKLSGHVELNELHVRVQHWTAKLYQYVRYGVGACGIQMVLDKKLKVREALEIIVQPRLGKDGQRFKFNLNVAHTSIKVDTSAAENDFGILPVAGVDLFVPLSPEDKQRLALVTWGCE